MSGVRPRVMGIVNVTPDSFSDGGQFFNAITAVEHAKKLIADGADWLDIGGESTRPGATPVPAGDELRRVLPVLEQLQQTTTVPLSIDTYKPEVAKAALAAGASILNDVTGFREPAMIELAANSSATCVVMHMRGTPQTMQDLADYSDVVGELKRYFEDRMTALVSAGVDASRIVLDPGIGFAKKRRHNLEILRRLRELTSLGRPILLGASRKRILGELTGRPENERLAGTIATAVHGYLQGVAIFRVHDVGPIRQALDVVHAIETQTEEMTS